jgi:DNA polymerase-1
MVDSVLKAVMERYPAADSVTYQMYLTASPNYRDWVAGIRPYKGNRTNVARPLMYDTIRRYLVEVWNAEIISGIEADDEISLAQRQRIRRGQEPAVIVHVDKDLNMIPGPHLNARRLQDGKPCWATVTEDRGLREFYRQVLTGDTADNIPGCHRVGPAKAKALIVPGMTEDEMYELCVQQYMVNLAQYPEHHGETEASVKDCLRHAAELKVIENARLLWMLTKPISVEITGGLWEPPTLRSEDE